jgi:hypothetical protein
VGAGVIPLSFGEVIQSQFPFPQLKTTLANTLLLDGRGGCSLHSALIDLRPSKPQHESDRSVAQLTRTSNLQTSICHYSLHSKKERSISLSVLRRNAA